MSRLFLSIVVLAWFGACRDRSTTGKADEGEVRFRTSDGFLLEGELSGDGPDAVILAHMFDADMASWSRYASKLDDSHLVLRFNFRGFGDSEGSKGVALLDRDVAASVTFVRKQGAKRVIVIGASMGGTAALIAATSQDIDGVVAISAPESFKGLDAGPAVRSVRAKMLFIACIDDSSGAAKSAQSLFKGALDPASDIRLLACSDHGTDIFQGDRGEEAEEAIGGFMSGVMS